MATKPRGANRDSFDAHDLIYRPALVDLRPEVLPRWDGIRVLHQGEEGACTGFALAAMINYLLFLRGEREPLSARMLFEMAKRYDQWPGNRYDWSRKIGFSNALFPSPWHPDHGTRRARVALWRWLEPAGIC